LQLADTLEALGNASISVAIGRRPIVTLALVDTLEAPGNTSTPAHPLLCLSLRLLNKKY